MGLLHMLFGNEAPDAPTSTNALDQPGASMAWSGVDPATGNDTLEPFASGSMQPDAGPASPWGNRMAGLAQSVMHQSMMRPPTYVPPRPYADLDMASKGRTEHTRASSAEYRARVAEERRKLETAHTRAALAAVDAAIAARHHTERRAHVQRAEHLLSNAQRIAEDPDGIARARHWLSQIRW